MILTCPFAPLFAKPAGLFPRELLDNWPTQVHCGTGLGPGGVQFVQRSVAGVKGGGGGGRRADSGKEAVPQADRPPAREGAGSGSALGALTRSAHSSGLGTGSATSVLLVKLTASPGATSFLPAPPPALLLPTALACHPVAPQLER